MDSASTIPGSTDIAGDFLPLESSDTSEMPDWQFGLN
jgi:hypothetical protein